MDVPFTVYAVLSLISFGLLALLLPLVVLPSFISEVPSRDFGLIHGSIVVAGMAKSGFAIAEMIINRQPGRWKMGTLCDVDAGATALLTMIVVTHFPLLAINTHIKVTTRDNPAQKIFSNLWAFLFIFFIYAIAALLGTGILVVWAKDTTWPLGAWAGVHCVPTATWWRMGRIVSLFVPLVLAIAISIPCVLSVTIRRHLFRKRDITHIRMEVGSLVLVSVAAMSFLLAVWIKAASIWPRPLEGAIGLLVFIIVFNNKVFEFYVKGFYYAVNFRPYMRWAKSHSDENLVGDEENAMPPTLGTTTVAMTRLPPIPEFKDFGGFKK